MKPFQRRYSKQRQIILEAVRASKKHPTAEEIYREVKEESPDISLGTVYRNLNLLAELGEIVNLNAGMECDHFDGVCADHSHLICTSCKQVFDMDLDVKYLTKSVHYSAEAENNPEIYQVRVTALGLCGVCKNSKSSCEQEFI